MLYTHYTASFFLLLNFNYILFFKYIFWKISAIINSHLNILSLAASSKNVGKTLICSRVTSRVSVSRLLSLTQQTTSVQLHQGRLLWATLSSGSVINNCLHPNLLPSLPFHSWLNAALPPQDGNSIKQKSHNPLVNFSASESQWHHLRRDRGCAKDKCLEMHYIILH